MYIYLTPYQTLAHKMCFVNKDRNFCQTTVMFQSQKQEMAAQWLCIYSCTLQSHFETVQLSHTHMRRDTNILTPPSITPVFVWRKNKVKLALFLYVIPKLVVGKSNIIIWLFFFLFLQLLVKKKHFWALFLGYCDWHLSSFLRFYKLNNSLIGKNNQYL